MTGAPGRVLVIGPGAVGSFLGGILAAAGSGVTLLGRRPAPDVVPGILKLEGPEGPRDVHLVRAHDPATVEAPDLVIVTVKAFHLADALATAARWPDVPLMTVQNGIGAEEAAAGARTSPILAGSLTSAVEPIPGGVRRLRTGGMGVAVVRGEAASLAADLVDAFTGAGLPAVLFPDSTAMKWSKLIANLVANASSAILDVEPAAIYADARTFPVERAQLLEALAVMRALGVHPVALPGAHVLMLLRGIRFPELLARPIVARAIGAARGGKSPSLRLHVREGGEGPTEARWLNGAVARAGAETGVPTPVNAALAALVDEVAADPARAAWFHGRPDRLRETVDAWNRGGKG